MQKRLIDSHVHVILSRWTAKSQNMVSQHFATSMRLLSMPV